MSQDNMQNGPGSGGQRRPYDQQADAPVTSENKVEVPAFMQNRQTSGERPPRMEAERSRTQGAARREGGARTSGDRQARQGGGKQGPVHRSPASKERIRRKKRRRIRAIAITLSILVLLSTGLYIAYAMIAKEIRGEDTPAGSIPDEVKQEAFPEYTGKSLISGLVCGIAYDNDTADGYTSDDRIGPTDLIMYVMYDTVANKANIMTIPRDTYIGEDYKTGDTGKINGLFYHAEDTNNRMEPLIRAVNDQLGLPVDFYITIDLVAFKEIIDIMSNIEVYVPQDVVYKNQEGKVVSEIKAGWQWMDGETAEYFVRNRSYGGADMMRTDMQQYLLSALYREFKTLTPTDLVMWMKVLLYRVKVGGIGPSQIAGLAMKLLNINGADITFVRPPVIGSERYSAAAKANLDVVYLVPDKTADLLNEYFRPDGHTMSVEELNIQDKPVNKAGEAGRIKYGGEVAASVRTMADVQESEEPKDAG